MRSALNDPSLKKNRFTRLFYRYSSACCSLFLFACLPLLSVFAQSQPPPIGQWREHLNYQHTTQVVKGNNRIYCAAGTHVFSVDASGEAERYTRVTGLNDIDVSCIGWDQGTEQLVIVYRNSNVDILKENHVKNIGDIKRSSIAGSKSINAIFCKNGFAYLSAGLGIIVADLSRYEIKDTWFIGNNGGQVNVNELASDNSFYYAATAEGLKRTSVNTPDPADYTAWQNISGMNGLPAGPVSNTVYAYNRILARTGDSIFIFNGNAWQLFYADASWPITGISASDNKLLVCQRKTSGDSRVVILSATGTIERILTQSGVISFPKSAMLDGAAVWVADAFGGLSKFNTSSTERFIPNGPAGTADGEMVFYGDTLFVAAGSVNSSWNYQYNRNGIYQFKNGLWESRGSFNTPVLDSVLDFITIAIDHTGNDVWAGSYGGGLADFRRGTTLPFIYKQNTTLLPATGDPGSYRVSGLAFDGNNNLWISNYGSPQNLQVRKNDGSWKGFSIPFALTENAVAQLVPDDYGHIWIMSPKDNGLICYQYGPSIDNTSDDRWKYYRQGAGNGNLPGNNVLCIAKDRDGFIWVGTDKGVGIIQCTQDVFGVQPCEAILPVVQQNGFNGYLFRDEAVQCIAVDGANRKWVGTKNGVWLVSPDGSKIIYRFTAENSPLLNNDVKKIAVSPATGEVFFATFSGICSFRSTATEAGSAGSGQVLVFPNPVPPGYQGMIAVRGLADNSLVKITELSGRLVFQGRATGGQFTWNGYDYRGNKAASGVYLVFAGNEPDNAQPVTKTVIVSGR